MKLGTSPWFDVASALTASSLIAALPVYARIYTDPGTLLVLRLVLVLQVLPTIALFLAGRALAGHGRARRIYWTGVMALAVLSVLRAAQVQMALGVVAVPFAARLALAASAAAIALLVVARWGTPLLLGFAKIWLVAPLITATMVAELALAGTGAPSAGASAARTGTVFVLVFDELGRDALTTDGRVDERRFPNIGGLVRESVWFTDATSNYGDTCRSLPSLLAGTLPLDPDGCRGFVMAEGSNLLVDLSATYKITIFEEYLRDCGRPSPRFECRGTAYFAASYPHLLLAAHWFPMTLRAGLLADLLGISAAAFTPVIFPEFLSTVTREHAQGRVYYLHVNLPHSPFVLDESGRQHGSPHRGFSRMPEDDPDVYANYLRQVAYVDALVGQLVTRLRAEGLYDRSTIVITGDHGPVPDPRVVPDVKGELSRLSPNVPVIVRSPGLRPGRVEAEVQLVDLRSTLLDVLKLPPVSTAGVSGFAAERPAREKVFRRSDAVYRRDAPTGRWLRSSS